MASLRSGSLPALKRQHLLAEFAGLKQACPDGVFVTLTPGDATLWSGVLFVRKGPYAAAILRFQISFPDAYPALPPLVTFATDIFHPLIAPLTTYTYTTDLHDSGTVSATDDERLPPGGFSLRHGFPAWFGRSRNFAGGVAGSRSVSGASAAPSTAASSATTRTPPPQPSRATPAPSGGSKNASPAAGTPSFMQTRRGGNEPTATTYDVLRYIASAFDDEAVLDAVPLEAAGNPGAWHAWRTKRQHERQKPPPPPPRVASPGGTADSGAVDAESPTPPPPPPRSPPLPPLPHSDADAGPSRRPADWNWDGVWEERVRRGIAASLSEPVLFGNAGAADDVIRFLNMERSEIDAVKQNLIKTIGTPI